jgi:hypothetical protein
MRVLIDENLPCKLADHLTGHESRTVAECGWAGKKNGELLSLAEPEFDVLLTLDKNIPYQQDLESGRIAILIVRTLEPASGPPPRHSRVPWCFGEHRVGACRSRRESSNSLSSDSTRPSFFRKSPGSCFFDSCRNTERTADGEILLSGCLGKTAFGRPNRHLQHDRPRRREKIGC